MIVVLERGVTDEEIARVLAELERLGLRGRHLSALESPLIHVIEGRSRRARAVQAMDVVEGLVPTPGPRIRARGRYFFPFHAINWISLCLVVLGILVTLAAFLPAGIGDDANAMGSLPAVSIPWYLRPPHAFLAHGWLGRLTFAFSACLVFFLPKLDRSNRESLASRIAVLVASALLLACWLFLSVT